MRRIRDSQGALKLVIRVCSLTIEFQSVGYLAIVALLSLLLILFVVLGIKTRTSDPLDECSTAALYPHPIILLQL